MAKGNKKQSINNGKQRGANEGAAPGASSIIPRNNYLTRGPAAVRQSHRETINWCFVPAYKTLTGASFVEFMSFTLNGPYDPDVAVGGTSAHGFAKYMAFYSKCFVLAARIKVSGTKMEGSHPGALFGLNINTTTAGGTAAVTYMQDGYCDYKIVGNFPDSFSFNMGCDIGKFLDKPDVLDDSELFCTDASNPAQVIVAHVWGSNYSGTSVFCTFAVEIEFDCVFTDPVPFT